MIKSILLDDIKISNDFAKTTPRSIKVKAKRNQIKQGKIDIIVIDRNNVLLDGYITYLILKEQNVESAVVCINEEDVANSYKLKDGITKQQLVDMGFREGAWQSEYKDIDCVSIIIKLIEDIELNLVVKTDPMEFDDFKDVLVLDSAFCQPYTPFYGDNYKQVIDSYGYLQKVVKRYNEVMNTIGIFERY